MLEWSIVLLIAWTLTAVILLSAPLFFKILRRRGLAAVERLMGMILIMISVQMLVTGLKGVM
jgi:multiple antibiotic resistance protein